MSKKKIYRAGTVIFHVSDDNLYKMLFMIPSDGKYGGKVPQCPKGKVEEDESTLQAALRESQEEVGLFIPNIATEPHELGVFLGRTTMYVVEVKDPDMFGEPCDETERTVWLTLEEFLQEGRDLHKPIVRAAARYIEKQLNKRDTDNNDNTEDMQ